MSGRPQGLRLTTTPGNFALARTPPGNRSWMCHWTHVENCIMTGKQDRVSLQGRRKRLVHGAIFALPYRQRDQRRICNVILAWRPRAAA
jgi:hypothetical protein